MIRNCATKSTVPATTRPRRRTTKRYLCCRHKSGRVTKLTSNSTPEIVTIMAVQQNSLVEEGRHGHSEYQTPIKTTRRRSTRTRRPSQRAASYSKSAEPRRHAEPGGQKRKRPADYRAHGRVTVPRKDEEANKSGNNRSRSRYRCASGRSALLRRPKDPRKKGWNLDTLQNPSLASSTSGAGSPIGMPLLFCPLTIQQSLALCFLVLKPLSCLVISLPVTGTQRTDAVYLGGRRATKTVVRKCLNDASLCC